MMESHVGANFVLRAIHVLRPLRLIARLSGLRQVIKLLGVVMPRIMNVVAVFLLFLLVFSLLGVQVGRDRAYSGYPTPMRSTAPITLAALRQPRHPGCPRRPRHSPSHPTCP